MQTGRENDSAPIEIAVAVVAHAGRYLIGRREDGVPLAGMWEFPGGKIEQGETPAAAAARECREETNLEVHVLRPFPEVVHRYDHSAVKLHFFACRPLDPRAEPTARFRWVAADELCDYQFPEANAPLVEYLSHRPIRPK